MNNFYIKNLKLYLLAFAILSNLNIFSLTWKVLGPEESDNVTLSGEYTNVAAHTDGTVYMSYRDALNSNKITVKNTVVQP